jgi:hypothetical protein
MAKGVCCTCQAVHPLVTSSLPSYQMRELLGGDDDFDFGDSINYVMAEHDFCGQRCEGVNMCPQTVTER